MTATAKLQMPDQDNYAIPEPFVGEDGIYVPVGYRMYKNIMPKELFVEAYNKWIANAPE